MAHEVPRRACTPSSSTPAAHAWAERNLAGTGVDLRLGDMATELEELAGHGRRRGVQPALRAARGLGVGGPPRRATTTRTWRSSPGEDGLDALRVLERRAALLLRPGGVLGAEHADVQGASAPEVLSATGRWREVRDHHDLAGRARFVTARLAR